MKRTDLLMLGAERVLKLVDLSPLNGARVLLTGATGLIGTHLFAALMAFGKCKAVTPMYHRSWPEHLQHMCNDQTTPLQANLATFHSLLGIRHADFVIHAAGYASPKLFMRSPSDTMRINALATDELVTHASQRMLFLSTSEVYSGRLGKADELCQGSTSTSHPRAVYIQSKKLGEALCLAREVGRVARASSVYGPGLLHNTGRVWEDFIERGLQGAVTLRDMGRAERPWCYVTDAVAMLFHVLLHGEFKLYNVGAEKVHTIARLAHQAAECAGAVVRFPLETELARGAPQSVRLDMKRLRDEFWFPYTSLAKGIAETVRWYKLA